LSKNGKLKIIPLGGLGEVGKNMTAYEFQNQILIVDAGIMFPHNDMLGIDYIIRDYEYFRKQARQVVGIVITHGHEDHIGAIHHVLNDIPVPVYATPLTIGLIEVKLARNNAISKAMLNTVEAGSTIEIGPFKVELFHICHSIPDAVGLGITTPAGLIVHMSDFKFDHTPVDGWPTDYAKLADFSTRGVDLLLSDSTNAERPGWTPSEKVIGPALDKVFEEASGRITRRIWRGLQQFPSSDRYQIQAPRLPPPCECGGSYSKRQGTWSSEPGVLSVWPGGHDRAGDLQYQERPAL
jgi:ribonuclease J